RGRVRAVRGRHDDPRPHPPSRHAPGGCHRARAPPHRARRLVRAGFGVAGGCGWRTPRSAGLACRIGCFADRVTGAARATGHGGGAPVEPGGEVRPPARHRVLAGLVARLELELPAVVLAAVDDIAVARLTRGLQYQAGHLLRRAVDQRIAVDLDRPVRLVATGYERSDEDHRYDCGRRWRRLRIYR